MIIELSTRDGIPYQYYIATDFLIFNHSLNLALQRTPLLLFSVETKKKSFERIFRLPTNLLSKTSILFIF